MPHSVWDTVPDRAEGGLGSAVWDGQHHFHRVADAAQHAGPE